MTTQKPPRVLPVPGSRNTWETRIRFGAERRKRFIIRHCKTLEAALERAQEMAEMAARLVAANRADEVEALVKATGEAENTNKLVVVRNLVRRVASGEYQGVKRPKLGLPETITFRAFAALWTEGELSRRWPDHVASKNTAPDDAWRLGKHINPLIGHVAVRDISLELCDEVMSALHRSLTKATRRHVAQILVRVMNLSVYPARIRTSSPIPRGWLPKLGKKVNYPILFPNEDLALMAHASIPIHRRLLYGFLHREGLRRGDAEHLRWRQIDFAFGTLRVEDDKTGHGRMFLMNPGVTTALQAWKQMKGSASPDDLVFTDSDGKLPDIDHLAAQLRRDLKAAGVTRSELFEAHGTWGRFNVHTLRHSYVTRSLSRGVPEDTVRLHTAHKSNELHRYREFANSIAQLKLDDLTPLHEAIPELRGVGQRVGHNMGQAEKRVPANASENPEKSQLFN